MCTLGAELTLTETNFEDKMNFISLNRMPSGELSYFNQLMAFNTIEYGLVWLFVAWTGRFTQTGRSSLRS